VVPTGGMAETILGYHKLVPCRHCGHEFPVNCSKEADPQGGPPITTEEATCPNCRQPIVFRAFGLSPPIQGGDRVMVGKGILGQRRFPPDRLDVIAFYYPPRALQESRPSIIYLKRVLGLPGETIAIHAGDVYTLPGPTYEGRPQPEGRERQWEREYMYENDAEALRLFKEGKFQIIRKSPEQMLALRRLLYDNDHQDSSRPHRWSPEKAGNGWQSNDTKKPREFTTTGAADGEWSWLRYQHILDQDGKPELITDFLGYNSYAGPQQQNWVGDLMLECDIKIEQAIGVVALELRRGGNRFHARFDMSAAVCTLHRIVDGREEELARRSVVLMPGKYDVRFANFDQRLTVWLKGRPLFGDGVDYAGSLHSGPTVDDLQPAGIGARGETVTVSQLRLWRDVYYTVDTARSDALGLVSWSDPATWEALRDLPSKTWYVQPGHYLVLGDNSPESSDSRSWGVVPERLVLGKALARYYPFRRLGAIR
jgi:signal peptidase I